MIGINSQILSNNGGNIGIGFAIPSNMARNVLDQLVSKGKVARGMLGVGIQQVTSDLAQSMGLKGVRGVLVNSVTSGGPADKAGVKTGDVILQLNGKDIGDSNSFRNEIAGTPPGTEVTLAIQRGSTEQRVRARLGELTPENARSTGQGGGDQGGGGRLGITVAPLTPDLASQLQSAARNARRGDSIGGSERARRPGRAAGRRRNPASEPPAGAFARGYPRAAGEIGRPPALAID